MNMMKVLYFRRSEKFAVVRKDRCLKKMFLRRANLKNPVALFRKTIGKDKISFYFNWKQFSVFKTAKFEFMVPYHDYGLWKKHPVDYP